MSAKFAVAHLQLAREVLELVFRQVEKTQVQQFAELRRQDREFVTRQPQICEIHALAQRIGEGVE